MVSDLPCNIRREGGQSLVIGGSSLVILEGKGVQSLVTIPLFADGLDVPRHARRQGGGALHPGARRGARQRPRMLNTRGVSSYNDFFFKYKQYTVYFST